MRLGTLRLLRRELRAESLRAADRLARQGVGEASVVLFRVAPSLDFITHLLGLSHLGALPLVVDHRIPRETLDAAGRLAGATHDLASAEPLPAAQGFTRSPAVLSPVSGGSGRTTGHQYLQLSSGTTAEPRLIGHMHADALAEVDRYAQLGGIAPSGAGSVVVACALASAWGLCGGLITSLSSGLEVVLPASLTARGLSTAVDDSVGRAVVLGVPVHIAMLKSASRLPERLSRLLISGAAVSREDAEAAAERLQVPVGQVYGSTETGLIAADLLGQYPGTAGQVAPSMPSRLRSADELEVALRTTPYIDRTCGTGRWEDGWFRTHDAVSVDVAGAITVLGRLDGLLSVGGKKFHVGEIERHICRNTAVENAVAFVTSGRIEVFVTVRPGQRLDSDQVNGCLPEHMRPHTLSALDRMPRTSSGKISRRREQFPTAAR